MENASKALLIAGSILIVILLIAAGVRIFDSTSGTADSAKTTMDATEIATFNSKFSQYLGSRKSKSDVISLLNVAIANNAVSDRDVVINATPMTSNADPASVLPIIASMDDSTIFNIGIYKYEDGYIWALRISK